MAENDTEATEAAPQAKLGMMQLLMIVGIVLVTEVAILFAWESMRPPPAPVDPALESEEAATEDVANLEPANYLPLDPALVVNLQGDGESHFLQTTIQLMTRNKEVYEAAKIHSPAIRNALIMLFGTVHHNDIASLEGKEKVREQARVVADEVLLELSGQQGIDALYLTSFVIQ